MKNWFYARFVVLTATTMATGANCYVAVSDGQPASAAMWAGLGLFTMVAFVRAEVIKTRRAVVNELDCDIDIPPSPKMREIMAENVRLRKYNAHAMAILIEVAHHLERIRLMRERRRAAAAKEATAS